MIDLKKTIRKNILNMRPYTSARAEYFGSDAVFLDANENPFGNLNRYPDPFQKELKGKIADLKNIEIENVFTGNGSDEIIDLAVRIFCHPGTDKVLVFTPTYGMYSVTAEMNDVEVIKFPLREDFQIDSELPDEIINDPELKIIFICSPNNPTGNVIRRKDILRLTESFHAMVFLDEAYIDFSHSESLLHLTKQYNNLIVSQTLSKSWGLAAARIGVAFADKEIIRLFNKVKPPYNVSTVNQKAALSALNTVDEFNSNLSEIISERERMRTLLSSLKIVKKVYHSDANFLLVEFFKTEKIYAELAKKKIIVRNRANDVKNCLRITVGKAGENNILIQSLKAIENEKSTLS